VLVLVLVLANAAQPPRDTPDIGRMFDHEKLDAYRLSIEFVAWVTAFLDDVPPKGRPSAIKHLDEASTSVALNIAEGNGKRSMADRARYLEIARGSALECAACLDVLVVRKRLDVDVSLRGKATLVRIVSTVTKLIEKLLGPGDSGRGSSTSTSTSTNTNTSRPR
jgi:four helix bundle protein